MNLTFELDELDVELTESMDRKFTRNEKPLEHWYQSASQLKNVQWLNDTSYQMRLSEIETITISTDMEEVV